MNDYREEKPVCVGGFGNLCNNDTQYHLQNRVYITKVCITVTTCCMPYFVVIADE